MTETVTAPDVPSPEWLAPRVVRTRDGEPVEIRAAERGDAAALLEYLQRVGAETDHLTFGGEGVGLSVEEEITDVERMRDTPNALMLVATVHGEIVGCLTFAGGKRPRTRHVGEFGISVARAQWGQGVGPALLEALLAWGVYRAGVRKINLLVDTANARAIALYRRFGFVEEGMQTRATLVDGQFHDVILMGRALDAPGAG